MSEQVVRVNLAELQTVRVTCLKCNKGVVEVSLDNLDQVFHKPAQCRFCSQHHFAQGPNQLVALKAALAAFATFANEVRVEFDLPGKQPLP